MNDETNMKLEQVTDTPAAMEDDTPETTRVNPQDYTVIRDMIKEMEDWNNMLKEETHSILKHNYGLTNFAIVGIIPYTPTMIESMTLDDINAFVEKYKDINTDSHTFDTLEDGIAMMKEVKELQMNLYNAEQETTKLKNESQVILHDYFEFLSSPEVVKARHERLNKMRQMAETEEDEVKKIRMQRMIDAMEQADTMDFIFKRLQDNTEKEVDSIFKQFFDSRRGQYVIERFNKRISKFGFDPKLYRYFFNLEENFLNEKYHAFNNLFLFHYMRYIAYADPYNKTDKLFVQSITSAIANMVYHKFNSTTEEQRFIHVIEKFEDYFMDKHDYFVENNTTHPTHPVRIQASAKYEADRKAQLIAKMDDLGITGYTDEMSANELQAYFNNKMTEMLESQKKERELVNEEIPSDSMIVTSGYVAVEDDISINYGENVTTCTTDNDND